MCQISHRFDRADLNEKIDQINDYIETEFKKHSKWSLLIHDNEETDFLENDLHFSQKGKIKLALEIRHMIRKSRCHFSKE